jgi:hypothetical protein
MSVVLLSPGGFTAPESETYDPSSIGRVTR